MKAILGMVVVLIGLGGLELPPVRGQLPQPRPLDDDANIKFSAADFNRLLQQLRSEREALRTDWEKMAKKNVRPGHDVDQDLQYLKQILQHLQKQAAPLEKPPPASSSSPPPHSDVKNPREPGETLPGNPSATTTAPAATLEVDKSTAKRNAEAAAQAHALFRARQFEDALTALRSVELKGQKAEVRAPVQYLMAMCQLHLARPDEALPLLREVANSRGDDKLAGCAQWHLDMLRWQRDVSDRLQDMRRRREEVEKRK